MPRYNLLKNITSGDGIRVKVPRGGLGFDLPDTDELARACARAQRRTIRERLFSIRGRFKPLARWMRDHIKVFGQQIMAPDYASTDRLDRQHDVFEIDDYAINKVLERYAAKAASLGDDDSDSPGGVG